MVTCTAGSLASCKSVCGVGDVLGKWEEGGDVGSRRGGGRLAAPDERPCGALFGSQL